MSKTIPQCRDALLEIANKELMHEPDIADAIREIVMDMYRRPPVRRAPPKQKSLDPQLKAEIVEYVDQHPDETYADIAHLFGVNSGRVSEAVAGFR